MTSENHRWCCRCALITSLSLVSPATAGGDPNSPGVLEPALTATTGEDVRIPNTDQATGDALNNVGGGVVRTAGTGSTSLMGHAISHVKSPHDDMQTALAALASAAEDADAPGMQAAARELNDILLGETQGRIYDGFAMLNFNRGGFLADHVPGEYKMKTLTDSGETAPGIDGEPRRIWEASVAYFYYDGQIDSDTFMLRVPVEAHPFDTLRLHVTIYSVETEDFAPTLVMLDHRLPGSVQFPFKGLDAVWVAVENGGVTTLTVDFPPLRMVRGIYNWGWRVHPPRIQFIQPVYETVNAHTGEVELEPQGRSFAFRNKQLSLGAISDAAPEKKMLSVAQAALDDAPAEQLAAMMNDPATAPAGTWQQWADLAADQRQLPQEAWDVLAAEDGLSPGDFGPYRLVTAYLNNEMYGAGPENERITGWFQGDSFQVKLINLDNHTHYFRNVDFGARLHDDVAGCCPSGSHSFEIMNFKPTFGAPKVAEMQWRAGWGFRPHFDVIQQYDVFARASDQALLKPFLDGHGVLRYGWQYSAGHRGGDFRFNPPPFIITDPQDPAPHPLREADGTAGLLIGRTTPGYGTAKMCPDAPWPGFCDQDVSAFNPHGVVNFDSDGDGEADQLRFPPFLRNPDQASAGAGDIIPPTPAWKPFLWINPANGTLFIDPDDPAEGFWTDLTYAHGAPVFAGQSLTADIEAPRASAQVFYQFDDLFHDNAIFSPHPTFSPDQPPLPGDLDGDGMVGVTDFLALLAAWGPCEAGLPCPADLDGDGAVGTADLLALLASWT